MHDIPLNRFTVGYLFIFLEMDALLFSHFLKTKDLAKDIFIICVFVFLLYMQVQFLKVRWTYLLHRSWNCAPNVWSTLNPHEHFVRVFAHSLTPSLMLAIAKHSHLSNLLDKKKKKNLNVVFIYIYLTVGKLNKQILHVR